MIPFLDLAADFAQVEDDARRRIDGVLSRCQYVLGPETAELEGALRSRLGASHAVAVSSGTDALTLSLLACGIGRGDAVLLPAFTFFASAGAVVRAGAVPVFCDIDRDTWVVTAATMRAAIDRDFADAGGSLRHRTSGARLAALMPVHLYGRACEMDAILALAGELGLRVIEDAAQAIDCRWRGRAVASLGDAGCLSFYPTKNLGGAGDGGLVVCGDGEVAARLLALRNHGALPASGRHDQAGINARMSELVAAVLNAKLPALANWTARRRRVAALYVERLAQAAQRGLLTLPAPAAPESHVWHQFAVRLEGDRRDRVKSALDAQGIATRVFYPTPLHQQPCFAATGEQHACLLQSEEAAAQLLCLPIHASLADDGVACVADALAEAAGRS